MKIRHYLTLLAGVLIIGSVSWRLTPSSAPVLNQTSPITVNTPAHPAPASVEPAPVIAAPIAQPVSAPASQPVATTTTVTAPHPAVSAATKEELNTMLSDLAALSQSGDMIAMMKTYTSPEELAETSPEKKAEMEHMLQTMAQNSDTRQIYGALGEAYLLLKNQTPEMNAAGDEATYQLIFPPSSLPAPMTDPPPRPITFQKINGKWYFKRDADGG